MSRRVLGVLAAGSAVLVSWVAASQPRSTSELTVAAAGDPRVLWNTYIGGTGSDVLHDIERNDAGDVFIVGTVDNAAVFPEGSTTIGSIDATSGSSVLVASFHEDGGFAWAVHVGGGDRDEGNALVLGPKGQVYVAGTTWSADFPGAPATPLPDGGYPADAGDGFLLELSPTGQSLQWSLRFGGSGHDEIHDMILGPNGRLFVAGETTSGDLPKATSSTTEGKEAFASSIDISGSAGEVYWTHLFAGPGDQVARSVAAMNGDTTLVYIAGSAPNTVAPAQGVDAFVQSFFADNGSLYASPLFVGGMGEDEAGALISRTVGSAGDSQQSSQLVLVGTTASLVLPDAGTVTLDGGGGSEVFVAAINAGLGFPPSLREQMLLGGGNDDRALAVSVGGPLNEDLYVGGSTSSAELALDGGFDSSLGGKWEGFVAKVRLDSAPTVQWLSFVGGSADDSVQAVSADTQGNLLVGGSTFSTDLKYVEAGYSTEKVKGPSSDMFLLSVTQQVPPSGVDGGGEVDAGTGGIDAGTGGTDAGTGGIDAGTGGTDAGTGGADAGDGEVRSPLGWSCGASGGQGGPGALALVTLVGLGLLVSRRRRDVSPRG